MGSLVIEPTLCCRRCWRLPPPGAGVLVTPLAARRRSGRRSGDGGGGSRTSLEIIWMFQSKPNANCKTQVTDDYYERNKMKTLEKATPTQYWIPKYHVTANWTLILKCIFTHAGCHITGVCDGDNRDAEYKLMFCLRQRTGAPAVAWSESRMLEY